MTSHINGLTVTSARPAEHAPRPVILGPDITVPGHPSWRLIHDRELGDGISVCLGQTCDVDSGLPSTRRESVGASLAQSTGGVPEIYINVNRTDVVIISPAAAREFAALLNHLAAQAENAGGH